MCAYPPPLVFQAISVHLSQMWSWESTDRRQTVTQFHIAKFAKTTATHMHNTYTCSKIYLTDCVCVCSQWFLHLHPLPWMGVWRTAALRRWRPVNLKKTSAVWFPFEPYPVQANTPQTPATTRIWRERMTDRQRKEGRWMEAAIGDFLDYVPLHLIQYLLTLITHSLTSPPVYLCMACTELPLILLPLSLKSIFNDGHALKSTFNQRWTEPICLSVCVPALGSSSSLFGTTVNDNVLIINKIGCVTRF